MKWILLAASLLLTTACSTLKKPFLYEAKQYSNRVYIFGTVHVGVPIEDVPKSVLDKFDASRNVIAEIDPDRVEFRESQLNELNVVANEIRALLQNIRGKKPSMAQSLSESMELPIPADAVILPVPELKLSQRLSPKAYALILNYLPMVDEELLEKLSTESVARFVRDTRQSTVMVSRAKAARYDPRFSLDLNLLRRASGEGKYVTSLDDDEVLSPHCRDLINSKEIVESFEIPLATRLSMQDRLVDDYRSGSEERIASVVQEMGAGINVCILDERNQKWLPEITNETERAGMYNNPPAFAIVGAGHLFGPQGLLELLRKSGYEVRRVSE